MKILKQILNHPVFFWALLALPSLPLLADLFEPTRKYGGLMHLSGEFSSRMLVVSLIITPLMLLTSGQKWVRWLMRRRRYIGVAAFGYALLHTVFYLRKEGLEGALAEWSQWGILTGWLAFLIFIPLAFTSNNQSVRAMGPSWKNVQRFVYAAALFTLLHWGIEGHWPPALVHATPVVALTLYRLWYRRRKQAERTKIPVEGVTGSI